MKNRTLVTTIFLGILSISCGGSKESITPSDWLNYYVLQDRSNKVTISGRAMKGRIKEGTVKIVPLDQTGKCDRNNIRVLATASTDEKGGYSVSYERIGAPICIFVVPSANASSKMYDEFSKTDLNWSGDSYLVSVMNEPSIQKRKQSGLSITPLTRFAAGRLEALVGNVSSTESTNINSLVSKSNKEIASKFGIKKTSLFSKVSETIFSKTETSTATEDYPEISEVEIDFDNPNDKNAVAQKAILGGLSVIANQSKGQSDVSTTNVEGVLDTFSKYVSSGRNDGRDKDGNILTIPGSDVPLGNNAITSVISTAINTYVQSGGAEEIGTTAAEITSTITLQDKLPEAVVNTVGDITPPEVKSFSPANDATNILPNASITITFNEQIDTSITSLNTQSSNGTCRGTIQVSPDDFKNCIGLTVNSSANPVIVLTPTSSLQGSSTYKIRVTTGLVDKAINPIALTTSRGFTTVDLTQPVILDVNSLNANATYQNGASINVRVTYAIPVVVTGTPRIRLNTTPVMYANYISGSGSTTIDFSYVLGTTENSPDLDYASTTALELNGATITNSNGLANAFLTLPAPGANGSLGANKNIVIDNSFPIVNFASTTSSNLESVTSQPIAVNLSKSYFQTVTVNYSVTGGTATPSGTDFTLANGTLTFPAGTTSQNISLAIVSDTLDELDETIVITLATPTSATIGTNSTHTYTITDDDTPPTVSFTSPTSNNSEATTAINLPVTLSAPSGQAVTVNYSVTPGSATPSGIDFTLATGSITFAPGITSQNIPLTITNDTLDEPDETLTVTLATPTNSTLGANSNHTFTITDDDASPTVQFNTTATTNSESILSATIPVSISAASGQAITVDYSVSGGTATGGADFTLAAGTLSFPAGTTSQNISLAILNDALTEPNETIIITLANPTNSAIGTNTSHTYTITDDDVPSVAFTTPTSSNTEATTAVNIPVSLSAPSTQTITVDYSLTGGTATAGTDFTLAAGTLTFTPGVTSQNIALTVTNDSLSEANETLIITLANPINTALLTNITHTYTINDDDALPTIQFNTTTSTNSEATTSVTIPVTLSTASGQAVTVDYSVTGGTAVSGTDFTLAAGTLNFPAGTTSQNVTLSITNDTTYEGSETVILTLANPTASTLGVNTAHTYTITDDDTAPTVQFTTTTSSALENAGTMTVTADLSAVSGLNTTIPFTINGSSTATGGGTDYVISASPLNIPPGSTSGTITITLTNDTLYETNEIIIIDMGSPTNATPSGNLTHTATITNDDAVPTISFTAGTTASVGEGAGNYVLSATLSTASALTTIIQVDTSNGSATSGTDYTAQVGQSINISAGTTTGTLNIPIAEDLFYEGNETFTITISSPVNATISGGATQTVTITDNEIAIVSATTLDCDSDGRIDHYQLIFDNPITDSTFPGYSINNIGTATSDWLISGYTNVRLVHGTALSCAGYGDAANDTIIYLQFTEGGAVDSGAKPDLTTTATPGLSGGFGTVGQIFTGSVAEADGAKPVVVSITPANATSNISVVSFVATVVFSESMNTGTFNGSNFGITGAGAVAGTVGTATATTTTFTASGSLANNQSHTINIANMADVNGVTMNSFSSTFTTALKNQVTGTVTNTGSPVTVTLTVNGTPNNVNGTTSYNTGNLLGIGDTYSLSITGQPTGKVCSLIDGASNPLSGTFSSGTDIVVDVNCVNGFSIGGHLQQIPPAELDLKLYGGRVDTIAGSGVQGFSDGTGTGAVFYSPAHITTDGTYLYVSDTGNADANNQGHTIRRINLSTLVVDTIGNQTSTAGYLDNANGANAQFNRPTGLTTNGTYLYIADERNRRVRRMRLTAPFAVDTLVGNGTSANTDGIGTAASMYYPDSLCLDGNNLFVSTSDGTNHSIRRIDLTTRNVTTVTTNVNAPRVMVVVGNNLYFVNQGTNKIMYIAKTATGGNPTDYAGNGTTGSIDGYGLNASFNAPVGLMTDGKYLYVSEHAGYRIRRILIDDADANKRAVSTIVGSGIAGFSSNAAGIAVSFNNSTMMTSDGKFLYLANYNANVIQKLSSNGLTSYYPLLGNANDYAGNNNGTLNNSPPFTGTDRFNISNQAFTFNGSNQYINASDAGLPSGGSARTGCAWIKPTSAPNANQIVFTYGTANSTQAYGIAIQGNGTNLTSIVQSTYGGSDFNVPFPIQVNTWTHICGTYSGSSAGNISSVYINGKLIGRTATGAWNTILAGNLRIGNQLNNLEHFVGSIADLRIYNRILTEGEINELAQNAAQAQVGASYSTGATGLLVNFHMDDGSSNSSGAIPDLGLGGSTIANSVGKDGNTDGARLFDGTSNMLSTTTPYGIPTGKAPRTYCGWIKPSSLPANGAWYAIASGGSPASYQAFGIGIWNTGAGMQIIVPTWTTDYFFNAPIYVNNWSHICATYDGTNVSAYLNGAAMGSPQAANTIDTGSNLFRIGAFIDGSASSKFNGKIDEVRIYNQALTPFQIRQLAVQIPIGLVARYDFNGDANDVSGFGNNGTVSSATPTTDRFKNPSSAYNFNGSSKISTTIPATAQIDNISLTAWVRPTSFVASLQYIVVNGTGANGYGILVDGTTGILKGISGSGGYIVSTVSLPLNVWSHVSLKRTSGNWDLLLNGRIVQTLNGALPAVPTGGVYMGSDAATGYIIGDIDDVRVYNRPLSEPEIRSLSGYHPMQVTTWDPTVGSSSLKFHLQADSLSNLANNAAVTGWNDSSGNALNLSQGNPSYQPTFQTAGINAKASVRFTRTNLNSLSRACETSMLGSTNTILGVVKEVDATGNNGIFQNGQYSGGGNGGKLLYIVNGGGSRQFTFFNMFSNQINLISNTNFNGTNESVIFALDHSGASGTIFKNGTNFTNSSGAYNTYNCGTGDLSIGRYWYGATQADGSYFDGYMGDMLYFNHVLNNQDRETVECYLSSKYNIPVAHPCP